jgi:frataxin
MRTPLRAQAPANGIIAKATAASHPMPSNASAVRTFHASVITKSIIPDVENPPPKESEEHDQPTGAAELTTTEFHERADAYLNELVERLEALQEKDPQIEVEYSVCYCYQLMCCNC